jgi:NAD(P)-dependent dehydrogenase (short-subunit alcohol dehydrogenase family)
MKVTRKVALIAGVGRGLSRGIALALAREGAAARYPAYIAPETQEPQATEPLTDGVAEATAITGATLNLVTALKAAQSLSSDITQDRLLETMMAVVIEHTGAQRGVFLREHDGRWLIVARQEVAHDGVTSLASVPIESCEEVPRAIIQYVTRAGEALCLVVAKGQTR